MRHPTACSNCRSRRRKCVVLQSSSPCVYCISRNLSCNIAAKRPNNCRILPVDVNHLGSPQASHGSERSGSCTDVFDKAVCDELVVLYFDLIHDKQHMLFHRPTFIADQRNGRAPMILVYAIMALAARFSNNPCFEGIDPWTRGRAWAEQSRILFSSRSEPVSLTALQACLLLHIIAFVDVDMESQSLYSAISIRMVQLLDLPRKLSDDRIQRETEIRIWWTTWSMDNWSAAASSIPRQLVADPSFPRPMEEIAFDQLIPGSRYSEQVFADGKEDPLRTLSLWTQMIPLTQVICQIDALHDMTVENIKPQVDIYDTVQKIASSLDSWLFRLPEELTYTPENLDRFSRYGQGRTLIALHLGYHHHGQLLFYQFLHQNTNSPCNPKSAVNHAFANRCKEHAAAVTNLLWEANSTPGHECLWVVNGHLLAVSSSIHLHTLLFGNSDTKVEAVKVMLERNFEMMMDMRRYWPGLDLSISRLRAFHRQCQDNVETSFRMDHWMLIFLQKYTKPVIDKTASMLHRSSNETAPAIRGWQAEILNSVQGI